MKIKQVLKNNMMIAETYDNLRKFYYKYLISDETLLKKRFKKRLGRELDLENPILFNDKLQWLKLNWYDPLATVCADKLLARDFVKERIGEKYLNEIYGVFENVEDINIDNFPNSFVLKGTHGSGFNLICKNKDDINWNKAFKLMNRWLKKNYYWQNREWVYKDIKPRIICEKYIEQDDNNELRDYRFFCFNGKVKFIAIDLSINDKSKTRRNLYDLEWNLMDEEISYPKELSINLDKPKNLEKMIELSEKLASDFPHARIDFFNIEGKIIFSEVTFFHQSGFGIVRPIEFEKVMGDWLHLPLA